MNLLAIVQSLHYEAKLPGSPSSTVVGQSGRFADLVRWAVEAWHDIQRDRDGRWKWLRGDWTLDTAADTQTYVYGDCTDVDAAAPITRFSAWDFDEDEPPFIYLVSEGKAAERELPIAGWSDFRSLYVRGTHTSARPGLITADASDTLHFGPTPNGIYRVTGNYWKSIQTLAIDADIPEMPDEYHMLIVYRALLKYGYNTVAQEVLARARTEGAPIYDALLENQWYGRFRMRLPGPLA